MFLPPNKQYPSSVAATNESTAGADASVEALKLYHMKLTLAQ